MAYFKLNNTDFSIWCNKLEVKKTANYNAQTNAGGNTVVDFINHKRVITVGIIPTDDYIVRALLVTLNNFNVSVSFLDPETQALTTVNCIIPESNVDYYTIQAGKTKFKTFNLEFIEL
jgi:hypothetical protein